MKKILLIASGCLVVLAILVAAILFRVQYNRTHVILDGPSMEPTIHDQQKVRVHAYMNGAKPQRGDVVVYDSTNKQVKQQASSGRLMHRVIALPGERITISNGQVLVYNAQHPNGFDPDSYLAKSVVTQGTIDTTLAPNTYFVMGDNRPQALDSRTVGPIPLADIVGKVAY